MVLGGEADILHAGGLGEVEPGVRGEVARVELGHEALVVLFGDLGAPLLLLVPAGDGVEAPVDEQAEADVGEELLGHGEVRMGSGMGGCGLVMA